MITINFTMSWKAVSVQNSPILQLKTWIQPGLPPSPKYYLKDMQIGFKNELNQRRKFSK